MLTALAGATLAVQQDDVNVTAIALMSHLGWVTALLAWA